MINHVEKKTTKRTSVFDKGQVIDSHRAGKFAREVSQMMAIGFRTVQRTIAQWKKYVKVQLFNDNSGRAKIPNTRDRRFWKRLEKVNRPKSIQLLTSMFNEDPKKISVRTMRRELKKMVLGVASPQGAHAGCDKLFGRVVYH